MSGADRWTARIYPLTCTSCGQVSHKSFVQLETEDKLPCDRCGILIDVSGDYGHDELDAIAKSLGSSGHILRERKKLD